MLDIVQTILVENMSLWSYANANISATSYVHLPACTE